MGSNRAVPSADTAANPPPDVRHRGVDGALSRRLLYFGYGSNLCTARLRARVPSAAALVVAALPCYSFRFHKRSEDDSAKADAFHTGAHQDVVRGVVFTLLETQLAALDEAEARGKGYERVGLTVQTVNGALLRALAFVADPAAIDPTLRPYDWYKRYVVEGAREHGLPQDYVGAISEHPETVDADARRRSGHLAVACAPAAPRETR